MPYLSYFGQKILLRQIFWIVLYTYHYQGRSNKYNPQKIHQPFYFSLLFVCGKKNMNEKCPIGSEPPWNWIPLWKTSLLIACPDLIMHCYQLYKPCIVSYIMTFKFQKELYWLFLLFCLQFVIMGNFPVMRAEVRCGWLLFNLIDN